MSETCIGGIHHTYLPMASFERDGTLLMLLVALIPLPLFAFYGYAGMLAVRKNYSRNGDRARELRRIEFHLHRPALHDAIVGGTIDGNERSEWRFVVSKGDHRSGTKRVRGDAHAFADFFHAVSLQVVPRNVANRAVAFAVARNSSMAAGCRGKEQQRGHA